MKNQEEKLFNRAMTYTKRVLLSFIVIFLIALPIFQLNAANPALESAKKGLFEAAKNADLTDVEEENSADKIRDIIGKIVGYILAMLGVILLVNVIFAGYSWMLSGGNEEKVKKAKEKIVSSIIGLAIIMVAYVLVNTIFGLLATVTVA